MSTQTQSELRGHRCKVSLSPLSLSIWHTHTRTHTPSPSSASLLMNWLNWSSYKLGPVLKGLHQYIDSFYEGHQTAITGHQGVPDCPGWLMSCVGMLARLGAWELWACCTERREERRGEGGGGARGWEWVLIECEIHWLNKTKLICGAADLLTLPHSISSNDVCCCRSRRVKVWEWSRFKHVHRYVAITCLSVQETWRKKT